MLCRLGRHIDVDFLSATAWAITFIRIFTNIAYNTGMYVDVGTTLALRMRHLSGMPLPPVAEEPRTPLPRRCLPHYGIDASSRSPKARDYCNYVTSKLDIKPACITKSRSLKKIGGKPITDGVTCVWSQVYGGRRVW